MGEKDITEKILELHNDVFADMVNGLCFGGKQVIKEDELEDQSPRSFYKANGKFHEMERDVVKRWKKKGIRLACIGFENQTASDPNMPLRVIGYDGAEYRSQLLKDSSGCYPVATLVLYFGYDKPWSGPLSILERFDISDDDDDDWKHLVSDYKINLYQIAFLTHEQLDLFKSDFKIVADYFVQLRETGEYNGSSQEVKHAYETFQLLGVMSHNRHLLEQAAIIKNNPQGESKTMKGYIDEMIDRKCKEALAEGKAQGEINGEIRGEIRGENKLALLMNKLFSLNRVDDARKAAQDQTYRTNLMKEFGIV